MTVGFEEVLAKQRHWRAARVDGRRLTILDRPVPVVLGPAGKLYALDRHHWMRALMAEGAYEIPVVIRADLQAHDLAGFWRALSARGWCRPYDGEGRRRLFSDIPESIGGLTDDPYRSLVGALRRAGVLAKDDRPFSEFHLADDLRRHIRKADLLNDPVAAQCTAARLILPRGH
jgi:hypothetical protein